MKNKYILYMFIFLLSLATVLAGPYYNCLQTQTNVSTACGGLSNGTFHTDHDNGVIVSNWSVPPNVSSANVGSFQYLIDDNRTIKFSNISIPNRCIINNSMLKMYIRFYYSASSSIINFSCYNGTHIGGLFSGTGTYINLVNFSNYSTVRQVGPNTDLIYKLSDGNYSTGGMYDRGYSLWTEVNTTNPTYFTYNESSMWWNMTNTTYATPSINSSTLIPSSYNNGTINQLINFTVSNPDNDTYYNYSFWYVNGISVANNTFNLSSGNFTIGDTILVNIIIGDAYYNNSYNYTIDVTEDPSAIQLSCQNTKQTIYIAFSLVGLLALIGSAFLLINMLKGGVEPGEFTVMVLGMVGLFVVLTVGFIVIYWVGMTIC